MHGDGELMTTNEILLYYVNLLAAQYAGQPNAQATVSAFLTPVIQNQLPLAVQSAFTVQTAIGGQLDLIAKYAGVSRTGYGLGNDYITLDDADFASLIKIAIIRNTSNSTLYSIQNLLHAYFANEIFVYDLANMQMSYLIAASVGSKSLVELFITEGLLPKPMGVSLASIIYIPSTSLFGFSTYNGVAPATVYPFNTYASYNTTWTWLSYANTIVF